MDIRLPLEKIAEGCALDYRASAAPAMELVQNGAFDSGAFWDTAGAGWAIAAGQATNAVVGANLTNTLIAPTSAGRSFTVSVRSVANPAGTGWGVVLLNSGTLATQTVMLAGFPNGIKTAMGTVTGVFDRLYIMAADDPGLVVDDVSFVS